MNASPRTDTCDTPDCETELLAPEVDIFETPEAFVIEAEMPGVSKENLEITLDGAELTVTGRRLATSDSGEAVWRERSAGDFQGTFELDPVIDTTRIVARINQGVLTVTLPKHERAKPQTIVVAS
jgi:HSP20 family protein